MTEPKTILLVEDNADDLLLAQVAFSQLAVEHRLVGVEDGEQALERLFGSDEPVNGRSDIDLMILDLKLPGMTGFEVLRRVRADARGALLPVVIMTSSNEEDDVRSSYLLGANSYVRKPTDFDEFIPLLKEVVHYWLHINHRALSVRT